jgi:hypothetical protein
VRLRCETRIKIIALIAGKNKMTKTNEKETVVPHITVNVTNGSNNSGERHYSSGKEIVKRNYLTALLLSIFLGWVGADRMYCNQVGLGLLKLFTFGGYGIWWIIDIIMFATKNVRYVEWD